jgi:hypothetical protein
MEYTVANVPYPLTASDLQELRAQIQELIRQVFEEKIGGADLGDVFSLPGDVLTLVLADDSGLTKSGNELALDLSATGGLNIVSDGLSVKLADTTITKTASGLSVTASYAFPVGSYYFNATGTDPATELGYGTWTQVAQGQFLVGET